MGSSASVPNTESDALAEGYTEDQIAKYLEQLHAKPPNSPIVVPPSTPKIQVIRPSGSIMKKSEMASGGNDNPYSAENRELAQQLDRTRCYPWSKYVEVNHSQK